MRPPLHPRRGPHMPTESTPLRRPGSVRRTTTIDMLRPDGLFGPVHFLGRGRDLLTSPDGAARELSSVLVQGEVVYLDNRTLTSLDAEPVEPALRSLVGQRLSSGFRSQLDDVLPDHRDGETLLYQILDDLPIATLISGIVLSTVPLPPATPSSMHRNQDLCAGWRAGGTIMAGIAETGRPPFVSGPELSPLGRTDDPLSWHEMAPLPEHGVRRHRRLDVWQDDEGLVGVDCFFRDSQADADATETAIHEYTVSASVDPTTETVLDGSSEPRVLPWVECPAAAGSATRIAGLSLRVLRPTVRAEFTGTTTCTHLNDQLRSLAGVRALLPALAQGAHTVWYPAEGTT